MALAMLAALAWGGSDFLAGLGARRMAIRTVLIGSELTGLLVAVVFLALRQAPPPADARLIVLAAAAGLVGLASMGLLYRAMREGSLAVVAPVSAGAALVPVAWGLLHGASAGPAALVGGVAALAGMTLASWPVTTGRPADPPRARPSLVPVNAAAVCGAGAALGFGAYFVLLHEAAPADPYSATAYAGIAGGLAALLMLPYRPAWPATGRAGDRCRRTGRRWLLLLPVGVGVLETVGDGAFALSAAAGTVGTAALLASMYPAVTVLLNTAVLRERLPGVHLAGVLSALLAVACLVA
ncbi:EamA family transporter [Actinoplanes sp. DH11]|uniref:EamA family transporter n=1 Tax=Actinoplanes sp. DH11 TaxID=2857011 RepID=UPI001E320F37|nr:EamA family transporter [Actinoplanes sp. DH11]